MRREPITEITGYDPTNAPIWHAKLVKEDNQTWWYSTGYSYLIIQHPDIQWLLKFWLDQAPHTDNIKTNTGVVVFPAKVIPNKISELVYDEMMEGRNDKETELHCWRIADNNWRYAWINTSKGHYLLYNCSCL